MTKFVKMSLAAAVAVAGLTSTAAAETSYSGKLYVENHASTSGSNASTVNGFEIDFDVTAKSKINDTLTAVAGIEADSERSDQGGAVADSAVGLEEAYFAYANAGAAVKFGRQGISTPNTDGEDGEGLMATYTAGNITAAAAYFANNAVLTGSDVSAVALLGSAGPVNFEAWNVNIAGKTSGTSGSHTTLVVGGEFAGVSASVRSASSSYNATGDKDGSTLKVVVSGKAAMVSLTGIYFATDKDGAARVTDATSANSVELVYLAHTNAMYDTTLTALVASAPVGDMGTAIVKYGTGDTSLTASSNADTDVSEVVLQYNHKLAKTTTASVRYADYSQETGGTTTDKTHARVDVTYKF